MADNRLPGSNEGNNPPSSGSPANTGSGLNPVAGGMRPGSGQEENLSNENSETSSKPVSPFNAAAGGKQGEEEREGLQAQDIINAVSKPQGSAAADAGKEAAVAAASGDMDKALEAGTRAGAVVAADSFAPGTGAAVDVVLKTKAGRAVSRWTGKALVLSALMPFFIILLVVVVIAGLAASMSTGGAVAQAYANDICIPKGGTFPTGIKGEQRENALIITQKALEAGVGREGAVIAVMTAMTQSKLRNIDLQVELEKTPAQRPLGLFQTPPRSWASEFWKNADGTTKPTDDPAAYAEARKAMLDPSYVSEKFFYRLKKVKNWKTLDPWIAATNVVPADKDGSVYLANYSDAISTVATLLNQAAGKSGSTIAPPSPATDPEDEFGVVPDEGKAAPPAVKAWVYGDQLTSDLAIMDSNGISMLLDNVLVLGYNGKDKRGPRDDISDIKEDPLSAEASVWVIGIGTYGGTSASDFKKQIDTVMSYAAGKKVVWWNYPPAPTSNYDPDYYVAQANSFGVKNQILESAKINYRNLYIADWKTEVANTDGLLENDGARLTLAGSRIRSKVAALAITEADPNSAFERGINTNLTTEDYLDALQGTSCADTFEVTTDTGKFLDGTDKLIGADTAIARALRVVGHAELACEDGKCQAKCLHLAAWIWGYNNACSYAEWKEMGSRCWAISHWEWLQKRGYAHPGDTNPPVGALMFFDSRAVEKHVAVYIGGGKVVTNYNGPADQGGYNVYIMSAKQLSAWGPGGYLGWALPVFTGEKIR